jgi:hypothetical protein
LRNARPASCELEFSSRILPRSALVTEAFVERAIGGDHIAVMLHLRSLYVSKAAILTIPVLSVPVENRSPA